MISTTKRKRDSFPIRRVCPFLFPEYRVDSPLHFGCASHGMTRRTENRKEAEEMEQFLQVGVISSTHGIRGEVKVFPTTDDPARYKKLKKVLLDTGKERLELELQSVKFFKQFVIVKFKGIDNINDVERYKGKPLLVAREDAVKLKRDEYYIADLIGIEVYTEDGRFGVLRDVMETGANEVYIIDSDEHGEVLVPAIRQCILDVDVETKTMKIHLLDGLV